MFDSIAKQVLQCKPRGHRRRERPRTTWRRDLESEMGTAGFKCSWTKMEAALKTELDGEKWSVACAPVGVTTRKSIQIHVDHRNTEWFRKPRMCN